MLVKKVKQKVYFTLGDKETPRITTLVVDFLKRLKLPDSPTSRWLCLYKKDLA